MIEIPSQIFNKNEDLIIKNKQGDLIEATKISVQNGRIISVEDVLEDTYSRNEIDVYTYANILYVPGVGSIPPRTRVVYKEQDYILLFGWHVNISNQHIYSWFLRSLEETVPDKTLYKEMIDDIDIIHFK